jgi:hypothetical protein
MMQITLIVGLYLQSLLLSTTQVIKKPHLSLSGNYEFIFACSQPIMAVFLIVPQ